MGTRKGSARMSNRRLRKLAGLNEFITDDPAVNAEIERRIGAENSALWLDALEVVKDSGKNGISPAGVATRVRAIHHGLSPDTMRNLIADLTDKFDNVVRTDHRGWLYWRAPEPNIEDAVAPEQLGSQVDLYATKNEPVTTRDDTMSFLRGLAAKASQKKAVQPPGQPVAGNWTGPSLVKHDGVTMFSGTHNECFKYIMDNQPFSVDWAMKNEGWEIVPNEL